MDSPTMQNRAEGPQARIFHRLPAEMQAMPQWCVAGASKAPMTADSAGNLRPASVHKPDEWLSFERVLELVEQHRGLVTTHTDKNGHTFNQTGLNIGFVFTASDPFACIDLDVENEHTQRAKGKPILPAEHTTEEDLSRYRSIVQVFDSYTETSRSGFGTHIIVRAAIGKGCRERGGIEVYSQERFLICTGNAWEPARPIADRQDLLDNMVTQMRQSQGVIEHDADPLPDAPEVEADPAIIARAQAAANGDKFNDLGAGKWRELRYPSQSEADMALMGIIAFWSPNNAQVKRIFRMSVLGKREKATKDDRYLDATLKTIRRRQAAQAQRDAEARESFKLTGAGLPANGDAPLPPSLDMGEMFNDLVYVAAEKQMALFRSNPSIQLPIPGMGALLKHNTTILPAEDGEPEREVPTFTLWQGSAKRKVVYTLTFDPSEGEFCKAEDGRPAYNLWKPRPHNPPKDWQQRAQLFVDHVAFLVPVEAEREQFLDWLAHIEQKPGILPHNHYLMIAKQQGAGRNWLAGVLANVWSGYVAMDFDLKATLTSGFNGQLSRKLLAVVDEINEGGTGERWAHSEKLKTMLTQSHRLINVKYGLQYLEKNCCRLLIFTNYETGLPLTADDRRLNVILNPSPKTEDGYYTRLYAMLHPKPNAEFIASVRQFLKERNISKFDPGARPVMNEAKQAVVAASMTLEDENAAELVQTWPREVILAEHLFQAVFGVLPSLQPDRETSQRWKLLAPIAQKAGIEKLPRPFALFGRPKVKVWVLRNAQRWRGAQPWDIERELCRPN